MIKTEQYAISQTANNKICETMREQIPYLCEYRVDNNPLFVSQEDYFGNIDGLFTIGGERIYSNQNKSRSDEKEDICIECKSCRTKLVNPETNEKVPLAGAYWHDTFKRWLTPRWGQADLFSVYLPGPRFIGNFSRYYLEIMFSKPETWETMTGIYKENTDSDTFIVFINYKKFCEMYLKTVSYVTMGTVEF